MNMTRQPSCLKFIYKLSSRRLKQSKWDLTLPLQTAIKNKSDVVALGDSQLLRWICELNNTKDLDTKVSELKKEIKAIKKQPKTRENQAKIRRLYDSLYTLQYQKDYVCVIMDSEKDYDRANQGFKINGFKYRRLLGTNGGVKKSTITYVSDRVYEEIVRRMDNGRNKNKPVIPAKLEAYQALICSSSTPVAMPRILIVKDCVVHFQEDVIKISDEQEGEPILTTEKDYLVKYCDSDGYGLMSPEYSRKINQGQIISGVNTRFAWTKGMLFTFDFIEFAKKKNGEQYFVQDAWGQWRDVRNYDVILTTSMVKLWDFYESLEHFIDCCNENHYQFSVSKTMPQKLEHVRNGNYQFLQTYDFTDEELLKLCKPTIDEITDVLGNDWRKTIVFLKGMFLNDDTIEQTDNNFMKAIMIDPRVLEDPFVIRKIRTMIQKRIYIASKGSIQLSGNFSVISGDLFSLAQSIFGLPVTGLLKSGQVYHKYWIDRQAEEIVLFRAPMTCHNNIQKRSVVHNEEMDFWYQYNTTGLILNSWDTTCDALNGADKDSDMFFTTDNPILLKNTMNAPTIECIQRKADKIIPTEQDLINANKLAFGDEIGTTTNRITTMLERQASFKKDSEEYRVLDYRIKCGQLFQQNSIDKCKGILAKPMPEYWYRIQACQKLPEYTDEQKHFKELCLRIVAESKPYFMKYVYPDLLSDWKNYVKTANSKCIREFQMPLEELRKKSDKTPSENEFLLYYERLKPVGESPCVVNRIAWLFEQTFCNFFSQKAHKGRFDYQILKSGTPYSQRDYSKIKKVKDEYDERIQAFQQLSHSQRLDKEEAALNKSIMMMQFRSQCEQICPNEKMLCDIVLDLCYPFEKSKQFAWDICGETILENLLEQNNRTIHYPVLAADQSTFEFGGEQFYMHQKILKEDTSL